MSSDAVEELVLAAGVLAREELVAAFGHLSARESSSSFAITPPLPPGWLTARATCPTVRLGSSMLAAGVPQEAWIHAGIYEARPDVRAVCRAQPAAVTVMAATGLPIRALHGHGALLGRRIPLFDDARLIRDQDQGRAVAAALGDNSAIVLRGNGAVTISTGTIGEAVARMWALEASARVNHAVLAAGVDAPCELSTVERDYWSSVQHEMLERIWLFLKDQHTGSDNDP